MCFFVFICGLEIKKMMKDKLTREDYIQLIQQKAEELGRFPKKSDFDVQTISMIKSLFGPWPRALEAAGVKLPNHERLQKKREKRRRARQNQKKYRREHPRNNSNQN